MYLIINTAVNKSLEVILASSHNDFKIKSIVEEYKQAENLLPLIEEILADQKKLISDIAGLAVVVGPGGFTALRIGVVTANVLAFALGVPVVGLNADEFGNNQELVSKALSKLAQAQAGTVVMPEYGREPNIS